MNKWNGNNFSVYDSEEESVLELIEELGSCVNHNSDVLETKTDLYGDHKGSWQGLTRPTMSDEGMRSTVEKIVDEDLPEINKQLDNITNLGYKESELTYKERIENEYVNILDFKSKTDVDYTNAFKNALAYCKSNNKTLFVPNIGVNYNISDEIIVDRVKIKGSYNQPVINRYGNGTMFVILGHGSIENLTLIHNDMTKPSNKAIVLGDNSNLNNGGIIKRISFGSGLYDCIYSIYEVDNILIDRCTQYNIVGNSIINLDNTYNNNSLPSSACVNITNNHFNSINNGDRNGLNNKYGVRINRVDNLTIDKNIINNYDFCLHLNNVDGGIVYNTHTEERRTVITERDDNRWSSGKTITINDIIHPTRPNANGYCYIALNSGVTGTSEPSWGNGFSNINDNGITFKPYKNSISITLYNCKGLDIKAITIDKQIHAIKTVSGYNNINVFGLDCYSLVDYVFQCDNNDISSFKFENCIFRGNIKTHKNSNQSCIITNCENSTDTVSGLTIIRPNTFYINCNNNNSITKPKTINGNYSIDWLNDSHILIDALTSNCGITLTKTSLLGKEITITKVGNDTYSTFVNSIVDDSKNLFTLSKKGDSVTLINLGYPNYYTIKSSHKMS